jgi:hypothetical protein
MRILAVTRLHKVLTLERNPESVFHVS